MSTYAHIHTHCTFPLPSNETITFPLGKNKLSTYLHAYEHTYTTASSGKNKKKDRTVPEEQEPLSREMTERESSDPATNA
jgi:hypothetical protein